MMTSTGRRFAAIPCERFMYVTMIYKEEDREQLLPFIAMCYFIVKCHIQCVFTTTIYLRSRSPVSFSFLLQLDRNRSPHMPYEKCRMRGWD